MVIITNYLVSPPSLLGGDAHQAESPGGPRPAASSDPHNPAPTQGGRLCLSEGGVPSTEAQHAEEAPAARGPLRGARVAAQPEDRSGAVIHDHKQIIYKIMIYYN